MKAIMQYQWYKKTKGFKITKMKIIYKENY